MSRTIWLHDRAAIAERLSEDRPLHVYSLGDLDDFFFPHTLWYALEDQGRIEQIALMYTGTHLPCLLALARESGTRDMRSLLRAMLPFLPRRFYAHVSPGVGDALEEAYTLTPGGPHHKMLLTDTARLGAADASGTVALGPSDRAEIEALYAASYPGNWFDPRMLATGRYVGAREDGELACVAGVHVYSPRYRVAALGNITTRPALRGRGLAARATAALCQVLRRDCDVIGLNVHAENRAAIGVYERLGFEIVAAYDELMADAYLDPLRARA